MTSEEMKSVWADHCRFEFELRDIDATLATMSDNPHMLNVPTGHGGHGRDGMRRFYAEEFIGTLPHDVQVESLGLAVGGTRVAEEVIMTFTHDRVMPWILEGVDPTGRQVRIPMLAVVGFRDGKVDYEHIWWDQASVLAQLGLLDTGRLPVLATRQADAIGALGDRGD
jgi:carboxymethylenebutenolidase